MCRTVHAVLQTAICSVQMIVRVFMTVILMIENLIRMIMQTIYNLISFLLQMLSLIPICVVFLVSARLKCFMCGGGGGCPVNRGGACDCFMSLLAVILLFFIFRATGILDKLFYSIGYAKTHGRVAAYVPTPGDVSECSRNETEYVEYIASTEEMVVTRLRAMLTEYETTFGLPSSYGFTNTTEEWTTSVTMTEGAVAPSTMVTEGATTTSMTTVVTAETEANFTGMDAITVGLKRLERFIVQKNNLTTILFS